MLKALKLVAFGAPALLCLSSGVLAEFIAKPDFTQGDAEKGKRVYQRVGVCVNCHGWAADGQSGINPMVHVSGANLRQTQLDAQGLYDTIRCGIPGTQMPYHDQASYKDDRCNGLVMSEAVMMGLGPYIGREYAHDLVYDLCREAIQENRPLIEILAAHPEISKHVTRAQLEAFCDPGKNLGQAGAMVDRVLAGRVELPR